ncbi:glycosyltransferase family 2 protein [Candidatus Microgenomates bacterium]|nr:glycosyltransferase family 2 protein [Candidatus Microgenomates bacterium]
MLKKVVVNYYTNIKPDKDTIVVDNTPPNPNRGFAVGVNLGIKKALAAGADEVLLVNPDVTIAKTQIEKLVKTTGDIIAPVLTFKRDGRVIKDYGGKINWLLGRPTHWENRQGKIDYVSGACMLISRQVIEKIGLFDPGFFMYFEDVDFCLRAQAVGFSVAVNPQIVVYHQISEQRDTHDKFKIGQNLQSNWIFINKWVPWFFKPISYLYWLLLWLKTR